MPDKEYVNKLFPKCELEEALRLLDKIDPQDTLALIALFQKYRERDGLDPLIAARIKQLEDPLIQKIKDLTEGRIKYFAFKWTKVQEGIADG